jgi:transcriptional regulator with XRE-family HTH domain
VASARLLAFTVDWWIEYRDADPVHTALVMADALHFLPLVDTALADNKARGKDPWTKAALAKRLGRNPSNVWRLLSGESEPSSHDLRSIASILAIPVAELFPSEQDRIAKAAEYLCNKRVGYVDSMAYAAYRLASADGENGHLDSRALHEVIRAVKEIVNMGNAEMAVRKVATILEPHLDKACRNAMRKREKTP